MLPGIILLVIICAVLAAKKDRINITVNPSTKEGLDALTDERGRSELAERYIKDGMVRDMSRDTLGTDGLAAAARLVGGAPSPLVADGKVLFGRALMEIRVMCTGCGRFYPCQALCEFTEHGKPTGFTIGRRSYHERGQDWNEPYFLVTGSYSEGRRPNNLCDDCWSNAMAEKFPPVPVAVPEPEGVD